MTVEKKCYYLSCYTTNLAVPLLGCDGNKTILDMRHELKDDFNFDHVDTLPSGKIKEAYNIMEFVHVYKGRETQVLFPVYPSNKLNVCAWWSKMIDIELEYGGAFLVGGPVIKNYAGEKMVAKEKIWSGHCCQKFLFS